LLEHASAIMTPSLVLFNWCWNLSYCNQLFSLIGNREEHFSRFSVLGLFDW
jgi:hypothetical protein